ncbi:MAG: hypothetical protein JXB15_08970 [Anaerolineales bacterium]|nr:hypothetical protein [Anaerolineales bacterium]
MFGPKDLTCPLCQKQFEAWCGDLILVFDSLCDECLLALWPLEGEALRAEIALRLTSTPGWDAFPVEKQASYIQGLYDAFAYLHQHHQNTDQIISRRKGEFLPPWASKAGQVG